MKFVKNTPMRVELPILFSAFGNVAKHSVSFEILL